MMVARLLFVLLVGTCITACVSVDFEGEEQALDVQPMEVIPAGIERGTVVWGGRIIGIHNGEEETELQVLGYPLGAGNVPRLDDRSVGRFVVYYPGYLEPFDYAPGRWVSLAGQLDGMVLVEQREDYFRNVPAVRSAQVHLWPRDPYQWWDNVNVGIGVSVVN